jgi:hypothetical protein
MSIELTEEQQQVFDAENGTPTVVDPRTQETYVLVRTEIYQRVRSLLEDDFCAEDAFRAQIESASAAGWEDPAMDVYNELDPRRSS